MSEQDRERRIGDAPPLWWSPRMGLVGDEDGYVHRPEPEYWPDDAVPLTPAAGRRRGRALRGDRLGKVQATWAADVRRALVAPPPPATIRTVDDLDGLPAGTVLRLAVWFAGLPLRALVELDSDGEWLSHREVVPPKVLVGAAVLHVPGPVAGGITREQVVEAVRDQPTGSKVMGEDVADRLGLVETEDGEQ